MQHLADDSSALCTQLVDGLLWRLQDGFISSILRGWLEGFVLLGPLARVSTSGVSSIVSGLSDFIRGHLWPSERIHQDGRVGRWGPLMLNLQKPHNVIYTTFYWSSKSLKSTQFQGEEK